MLEKTRDIAKVVRGLGASHPLRLIAQRILAGQTPADSEIEAALTLLREARVKPWHSWENIRWLLGYWRVSPEHTEREVAVWILEQSTLSPNQQREAAERLAALLEKGGLEKRIHRATVGRGFARSYLFFLVVGILPAWLGLAYARQPITWMSLAPVVLITSGFYGSFFALGFVSLSVSQNEKHRTFLRLAVLRLLTKTPSLEALPVLAETAATAQSVAIWRGAATALLPLLSSITQEQEGTFSAKTVANLGKQLRIFAPADATRGLFHTRIRRNDAPELVGLAIELQRKTLYALKFLGNASVIPRVTEFIKDTRDPQARTEAEALLEILEERKRRTQERATLLRGSEAPETLLRPAAKTEDSPADLLLRPSAEE